MSEDHDRRTAREPLDVALQPLELLGAQASETFGLVALHVDEADEVHAPVVEALPALAADRALAVAGEVFLAAVEEDVVLTGHVEHALGLHALEHLRHRVERPRLLGVREIARVKDEGRRCRQRVDPRDRLAERRRHVFVRLALEADVGVADLDEAEVAPGGRLGGLCERPRGQHAARRSPDHSGPHPGHALEKAATIHVHVDLPSGPSVHFTTTVDFICGCSAQK